MTDPTFQTRPRRRLLLGAAVAGAFAIGGLTGALGVGVAFAHPGHGGTRVMVMGGGHGDMHAMGAAHLDKMLDAADATPDQKAKINAIVKQAFGGMKSMHGGMQSGHEQIHELLTAPTIDRAALERLRAQHIAEMDKASKTMVSAMADAAEVLTPAQRAKLRTAMQAHRAEHNDKAKDHH